MLEENSEHGFICPGTTNELQCYGYTGVQVLDSLGQNFTSITGEDHILRNSMILLGIAVAFKLNYCLMFMLKTMGRKAVGN